MVLKIVENSLNIRDTRTLESNGMISGAIYRPDTRLEISYVENRGNDLDHCT